MCRFSKECICYRKFCNRIDVESMYECIDLLQTKVDELEYEKCECEGKTIEMESKDFVNDEEEEEDT